MHVCLLSDWARSGRRCNPILRRAKERHRPSLRSICGKLRSVAALVFSRPTLQTLRGRAAPSRRELCAKQTPVLPPMPLFSSKLRSVAVGQDHVFSSSASNFLKEFVVARKSVLLANWRTFVARLAAKCFCILFALDPVFSMACLSCKKGPTLGIRCLPPF